MFKAVVVAPRARAITTKADVPLTDNAASFASMFRSSNLAAVTYAVRGQYESPEPVYAARGSVIPKPMAPAKPTKPNHQREFVFTAPKELRAMQGEWGLKHSLR